MTHTTARTRNTITPTTAGCLGTLLLLTLLIIPPNSIAATRSDQSLAPDYGLEDQYVAAPDQDQPLPVDPPHEYTPPELLEDDTGQEIDPPQIDNPGEIIPEPGDNDYPTQEEQNEASPEINLDDTTGSPLIEG